MRVVPYAWRALKRDLRGGDLLTVAAALVLGVAVMTAVGTLVNRVSSALVQNAAEIIGGDFGVAGRQAIPAEWIQAAGERGLDTARLVQFPTVVFAGDASQLADIKAVDSGYPLRGELVVSEDAAGTRTRTAPAPGRGEGYADARLMDALGIVPGSLVELGDRQVRISQRLVSEPDAGGELFQLAPRLLVNLSDVEDAGLLGPGSRASHRLMFAGTPGAVDAMRDWLQPRLTREGRRFRLITIEDAQEAVSGAFERAGRFLSMAALLAVLLAGVATALAANRFALRRIDQVAVLRCLGARQHSVLTALALQLVMLAIPACAVGIGVGLLAQAGLVEALGTLVPDRLPLPQAAPALAGAAIGILLLLGFGLPPLLRLRGVPPMRVLNRSFAALPPVSALVYLAAIAASVALIVLATRDLRLAMIVLGGLAGLAGVSALAGWGLLSLLRLLQPRLRGHWRLGLSSLARRRGLGVVQLVGLSLSLSALLLLAAIGPALLQQWRGQLPDDTPNYFVLNIQPAQRDEVIAFLGGIGVEAPRLEPFATGRLVAVNGAPAQRRDRDLLDGEFADGRPINMSWRRDFPPANTLLEGRFWDEDSTEPEVSVEQGWAQRYDVGVGDVLTIGIGEQRLEARISNIRAADWDSFRVNFFLLLNENAIGDAPHNLVSAFHLPEGAQSRMGELSRRFPNVSLLDVDAILERVREVIDRVAQAVQLVLGFSLAAGVLVLVAALQASASERRFESAVLRTLGARRGQLRAAVLAEFALVGGIAAVLAIAGAALTGLLVARFGFEMGLALPWRALVLGGVMGMALSMLAGWLGTRQILRTPPARSLREA